MCQNANMFQLFMNATYIINIKILCFASFSSFSFLEHAQCNFKKLHQLLPLNQFLSEPATLHFLNLDITVISDTIPINMKQTSKKRFVVLIELTVHVLASNKQNKQFLRLKM